jgi:hypothetical protein
MAEVCNSLLLLFSKHDRAVHEQGLLPLASPKTSMLNWHDDGALNASNLS